MVDYLNTTAWWFALVQALLFAIAAPLLFAWVGRVKARLQNRRGRTLFQPYRDFYKLFFKEALVNHNASGVFHVAPYIVFATTWLAAAVVPLVAIHLPTAAIADVIVLVGLLALARFFLALAAMDVATAIFQASTALRL